MIQVKLTFSVSLHRATQLQHLRCAVDHLLILLGIIGWRWEFDNGAVKEIIRGPFEKALPEVFNVPLLSAEERAAQYRNRRQG